MSETPAPPAGIDNALEQPAYNRASHLQVDPQTRSDMLNASEAMGRAETAEHFWHAAQALLEKTASLRLPGNSVRPFMVRFVLNGIRLGAYDSPQTPERLKHATQHASADKLRNGASLAFGQVLSRDRTAEAAFRWFPAFARSLEPTAVVRALAVFDAQGLIGEDFWRYSLAASIASPALLPLMRAKLDTPELPLFLRAAAKPEVVTADYIATLLAHYEQDPTRHRANTTRILEHARPQDRSHNTIGLRALIQLSNTIVKRIGAQPLDSLDPQATTAHAADALNRTLCLTRRPDLHPESQVRQVEQDVMYSEIVALINGQPSQYAKRALTALALQHPRATSTQIKTAQSLLEHGAPIGDVLAVFAE